MVWFDATLRFPMCESGISGNTKEPPIKTSFSSMSGFIAGDQ